MTQTASQGEHQAPMKRVSTPVKVVTVAFLAMTAVVGTLAAARDAQDAVPQSLRTVPDSLRLHAPDQAAMLMGGSYASTPEQSGASRPVPAQVVESAGSPAAVATVMAVNGIPETALKAYQNAADVMGREQPGCGLHWSLLAGIGQVESGHGRGKYLADGTVAQQILGPPLDGSPGVARIVDANGNYVRATGPMQFLPTSWTPVASDGNGDGKKDINNMYDAALGAAKYLCRGGGDLRQTGPLRAAVFRYNNSNAYVDLVLALAASYRGGEPVRAPESILPAPLPATEAPIPARPEATTTPEPQPHVSTTPEPQPEQTTTPAPPSEESSAPPSSASGGLHSSPVVEPPVTSGPPPLTISPSASTQPSASVEAGTPSATTLPACEETPAEESVDGKPGLLEPAGAVVDLVQSILPDAATPQDTTRSCSPR
ncbi:lytic murein transglycosylase [Lentzea sp. E54]|uniref:lytic transglycosylase domain-containing protein n=1 Tax=Lentzea xerophila TaxID=3435883 RepID=UPI003DA4938D